MPNKFEYTPLPPLSKGDLLEGGKYEIISDTENAGGFGRIYRARVRQTSATNRMKVVAVKEFHVHEIDVAPFFAGILSIIEGEMCGYAARTV